MINMTNYTRKDVEQAERTKKELIKARNNACSAISEASARYIKKKTKARSRKAAMEKDGLLQDPRFRKLDDYESLDDVQEAFGVGYIDEKERDQLWDLWEEREAIREKTVDGFYTDLVTEALDEACAFVSALWEDQIEKCDAIRKEWAGMKAETDAAKAEQNRKVNEEYKQIMGGKS